MATLTAGALAIVAATPAPAAPEDLAAVTIRYLYAVPGDGEATVRWATDYELNIIGFYVHRLTNGTTFPDDSTRVSPLIPGENNTNGSTYEYVDTGISNGVTYYYWLEDEDSFGFQHYHGSVSVTPGTWFSQLPVVLRR